MIPAESFWTHSLHSETHGAVITRILAAAIAAVDPGETIRRDVKREGDFLIVHGGKLDLLAYRHIVLLGIGKASVGMSAALVELLGDHLHEGVVITKDLTSAFSRILPSKIRIFEGGHPIPDERSLIAGREVVQLLSGIRSTDLLICLLSGGGSALVSAPVSGVNLMDMQELTRNLLACGAGVGEINSLRRRLDILKGGGVARLSNGAAIVSLILSDVIGNRLEAISSGPTAPDPVTMQAALSIVKKYELEGRIPVSIMRAFQYGTETPKPGDPQFINVHNILVGSNLVAAQGALRQAEEEGFHPYLLRTDLEGEARQAAFMLATYLRQAKKMGDPVTPPGCIIAGGETTVTVTGTGKGGRNTELALAAVNDLADFPGVMLVTLATDGEDGSTDAAGAVVTGDTYRRARERGMQAGEYLVRNDSYRFFEALGDLLKPGPTGTNVNDLTFMFLR